MKVCKFSGAVLTGSGSIVRLKEIVASDAGRRVIVPGAPGRTETEANVTDLLIECAERALRTGRMPEKTVKQIGERFLSIFGPLGIGPEVFDGCFNDLRKRILPRKSKKAAYRDRIKAFGEEYTARFIALYLSSQGMNCRYVDPREAGIQVSPDFGNAALLESSYQKMKALKEREGLLVIPGFYGYTVKGRAATFSRGGNDLTGSVLAHALDAEVFENFIDYDGIPAIKPGLTDDPLIIPEMTFQELRELTYAGFRTFHEEFLYPVMKKGIPMRLINFSDPSRPGTLIVKERKTGSGGITGIAFKKGFCTINVEKYLMNVEKGFGRRLLQILEEHQLSYDHSPTGIDATSVILRQDQLPLEKIRGICRQIYSELNADNVYFNYNRALISVVGSGVKESAGLLTNAARALEEENINAEMIIKGGSETSVILCVEEEKAEQAVRGLYRALIEPRKGASPPC